MTDSLKSFTLDILSILLPGGLLMVVLARIDPVTEIFFAVFAIGRSEWVRIILFGSTAYILGHFIFSISSFLDDWFFDDVKRAFWNDYRLVAHVLSLKAKKTGIYDRKVLNAFKWSCAFLQVSHPAAYGAVERYIAESKFFRSLVIVMFIAFIVFAAESDWILAAASFALMILCFYRYVTQRQKSLTTAYEFVVAASKEIFIGPDKLVLEGLRRKNIDPCEPMDPDPDPTFYNWCKSVVCTCKKILVVVNLWFNPFYGKRKPQVAIDGKGKAYKSREVRWFFKVNNNRISTWFSEESKTFSKIKPRTDFYLSLEGTANLSIKLREGNIEVKRRQGQPSPGKLAASSSGIFEEWNKWSFDVADDDLLSYNIIKDQNVSWIEVRKERIGVKFVRKDGAPGRIDIKDYAPSGCQVEYTRLLINNEQWFTFALEWFGSEQVDVDDKIFEAMLHGTKLELKDSMGYPEFLSRR